MYSSDIWNKLFLRQLYLHYSEHSQDKAVGKWPFSFCTDSPKQAEILQKHRTNAIHSCLDMQTMEAVTLNQRVISQIQTHTLLCLYSLKLINYFHFCCFLSFSGKGTAIMCLWEIDIYKNLKCMGRSHRAARICTDKSITRYLQGYKKTQGCCQQWQTRIPEIMRFYQV